MAGAALPREDPPGRGPPQNPTLPAYCMARRKVCVTCAVASVRRPRPSQPCTLHTHCPGHRPPGAAPAPLDSLKSSRVLEVRPARPRRTSTTP